MEGGAERMLAKAVDAIELALRDPRVEATCPTSIFLSVMPEMMGTLEETAEAVSKTLSNFIASNSTRLLSVRLDEVEIKVRLEKGGVGPCDPGTGDGVGLVDGEEGVGTV